MSSSQAPLDQYSIIKKSAFEGAIGALFALAILASIARFIVRIYTRRPLYWDDLALGIGAACLSVATALILKNEDNFFLGNTLQQDPSVAFIVPSNVLNNLLTNSIAYLYSFLALAWTTIFAVKISFLIFFKQLIHRLGKINTYYWVVTGVTVLSWAFLVAEPFILCPYFGYSSIKCYGPTRDELYVGMTSLVTALDVMTDIMIASIPILVLRKSQIPKKQKIILACFLCLSLVMTTFAITRVGKIKGSSNVDLVWELFWMYMEAGVAVLMCSLTVFRTIFNTKQTNSKKRQWEPSASWIQRMKWKKSAEKNVSSESDGLPSVPSGTLSGLRTFIRRNNRSTAAATSLETNIGLSQMGNTQLNTMDEEKHRYHGIINVKKDYTVLSTMNFSRPPPPHPTVSSDGTIMDSGNYGLSYGGNTMISVESRSSNNQRALTSFV